jgi:hypothetical protein
LAITFVESNVAMMRRTDGTRSVNGIRRREKKNCPAATTDVVGWAFPHLTSDGQRSVSIRVASIANGRLTDFMRITKPQNRAEQVPEFILLRGSPNGLWLCPIGDGWIVASIGRSPDGMK